MRLKPWILKNLKWNNDVFLIHLNELFLGWSTCIFSSEATSVFPDWIIWIARAAAWSGLKPSFNNFANISLNNLSVRACRKIHNWMHIYKTLSYRNMIYSIWSFPWQFPSEADQSPRMLSYLHPFLLRNQSIFISNSKRFNDQIWIWRKLNLTCIQAEFKVFSILQQFVNLSVRTNLDGFRLFFLQPNSTVKVWLKPFKLNWDRSFPS